MKKIDKTIAGRSQKVEMGDAAYYVRKDVDNNCWLIVGGTGTKMGIVRNIGNQYQASWNDGSVIRRLYCSIENAITALCG